MKTLFLLALATGLVFSVHPNMVAENPIDAPPATNSHHSDDEVFELLSDFLMKINKQLLETATSGNYSDADFRSWAADNYGSVRSFRNTCKQIQKGFEQAATDINADLHTARGADRVIDHILGSKEDRLAQIARADSQHDLKSCYESFVSKHQSCLATSIVDGLFEYQDWHTGAQLMNCMARGVRKFHDCTGL